MTIYRITPGGKRRRAGQHVRSVGVSGRAFSALQLQPVNIAVTATADGLFSRFALDLQPVNIAVGATASGLTGRATLGAAAAGIDVGATAGGLYGRTLLVPAPAQIGMDASGVLVSSGAWARIGVAGAAGGMVGRAPLPLTPAAIVVDARLAGLTGRAQLGAASARIAAIATASGALLRARLTPVHALIAVDATATLSNNPAPSWRARWLDVYGKRQVVLNAIDANNRYLAKDAQLKGIANADAIVQTNARVKQVDDRITSEAYRTTLLTAEVNRKASAQALQSLSATVTQHDRKIESQGNLIQGVRIELSRKASAQALQALDTRVTEQGDQITAVSQSVTTVSAKAQQADNKAELAASATQSLSASVDTLTGRMDASYNLAVQAGGRIAGMRLGSNGQISRIDFVGDAVRFVPPDGAGSGVEFDPGAGLIRQFSGAFQMIQSSSPFGADGLVQYFGPNVGMSGASKSQAALWADASGNVGLSGVVYGSLISGSALSLESLRIRCGDGRYAPFTICDTASDFVNHTAGTRVMTSTCSGFISPDSGSGYNHKRFARHRMDVQMHVNLHTDHGWEEIVLEVQYDGGTWQQITGTSIDGGYRNSATYLVRYTTLSNWQTVAFRARTIRGLTTCLTLRIDIANYNESGNPAGSSSNIFAPGGTGGQTPLPPPPPPRNPRLPPGVEELIP